MVGSLEKVKKNIMEERMMPDINMKRWIEEQCHKSHRRHDIRTKIS